MFENHALRCSDIEHQMAKQKSYRLDFGYKYVRKLGEGSFGKVYLSKERSTGKLYAIKIIDKKKFHVPEYADREFQILKSLNHKNIIKLHGYINIVNGSLGDELYLLLEYSSGGSLHGNIIKTYLTYLFKSTVLFIKYADNYFELRSKKLFYQLICGVQYLHSKGVAHRDLKPENILLDDGTIKIADFGIANKINKVKCNSRNVKMFTQIGTPKYCAPEVLNNSDCGYDGFKADIFSLGIILHDMTTNFGLTSKISLECYNLIYNKLTSHNPSTRPSAGDILNEKWLS